MAGNMQHFFVRSENYHTLPRSENYTLWECDTEIWSEESEVAQSRPSLWDPMDWVLPGSSVHGIFQAIVLEWIAISFSRASSWPRDQTQVSRIVGRHFTVWATRELSKGYWKNGTIDLFNARLPQTFNLKKNAVSAKNNKTKYAYTYFYDHLRITKLSINDTCFSEAIWKDANSAHQDTTIPDFLLGSAVSCWLVWEFRVLSPRAFREFVTPCFTH